MSARQLGWTVFAATLALSGCAQWSTSVGAKAPISADAQAAQGLSKSMLAQTAIGLWWSKSMECSRPPTRCRWESRAVQ